MRYDAFDYQLGKYLGKNDQRPGSFHDENCRVHAFYRSCLAHGHLAILGPLDDGDHFIDAFNEAPLHPNSFDYLKEHHYTHVEFMPLSEHPFDGSWGYQNTGFFAPTSRYGTALQLKALIDKLHNAGIGAIMDFVPVHFAVDAYGLKEFDGTALYEYPHQDVGESEWGSCNFIHSHPGIACFLQSAANYWLKE